MDDFKHIYYYWDFGLGTKFCDDVIRFSKSLNKRKGKTGNDTVQQLNPLRKSEVIWMSEGWIYKEILKFIHTANREGGYNFDLEEAEAIQYTRYGLNQFYGWHKDLIEGSEKDRVRKLSICINLTDPKEFEGGDFLVNIPHPEPEQTKKIRLDFMKKRGAVVVFPSTLYHQVAPITKGVRHSLVCWMKGPRFK